MTIYWHFSLSYPWSSVQSVSSVFYFFILFIRVPFFYLLFFICVLFYFYPWSSVQSVSSVFHFFILFIRVPFFYIIYLCSIFILYYIYLCSNYLLSVVIRPIRVIRVLFFLFIIFYLCSILFLSVFSKFFSISTPPQIPWAMLSAIPRSLHVPGHKWGLFW